jgi:hypothetical protein
MKKPYNVGLAFLLVGCASSQQSASLPKEDAKALAIRLANGKVATLYHSKPFQVGHLTHLRDGRWIWTDSRGFGHVDIQARVELAADGSTNSVEINILTNESLLQSWF